MVNENVDDKLPIHKPEFLWNLAKNIIYGDTYKANFLSSVSNFSQPLLICPCLELNLCIGNLAFSYMG